MLLKVSGASNPRKLAAAICGGLRENDGEVEVQAIGAAAVNQALKGVIIARSLSAPKGGDLKTVPGFADVEVDGRKVTAVRLRVFWR